MRSATLFFLLSSAVLAQAAAVSVKGPVFPGLRMTLATDPRVREFVAAAIGTNVAEDLSGLLPYSVVLENSTAHTLYAYTLRLTFVDPNGQSGGHNRQYFNLDGTSNGAEIAPGTARLVTPTSSMAPSRKWAGQGTSSSTGRRSADVSAVTDRLRAQVAVVVAIDLIVFDTGLVVGPDEGNTLSYLRGYLTGEREAASLVTNSLKKGASISAVSRDLERVAGELAAASTFYDTARGSQFRRFLGLTRSSGDSLMKEVDRVLGKPPFEFHR